MNSVITMGQGGEMKIDFASYPKIPGDLKKILDAEDLQEEE